MCFPVKYLYLILITGQIQMASSTASKYDKLNASNIKGDGSQENVIFPKDLMSGDNQELTSMTLFFNTIKNHQNFNLGLTKSTSKFVSPYSDIPIVHGELSSGLLKKNGGSEVFSNMYERSPHSITLPLPRNLQFDSQAQWNHESLGELAATLDTVSGIDDMDSAKAALKGLGGQAALAALKSVDNNVLGGKGNLTQMASIGLGMVANTYVETMFKQMEFRNIPLEWTLTPRNPDEAKAIRTIGRMLRFHQAPEFLESTANNFILYPSSVDVVFWLGNKPHPYIPRMMTAVITNLSVNLTPNGDFHSMVDGSNQATRISFVLSELKTMHKKMFEIDKVGTSF